MYLYNKADLQALKIDLIKWSDEFKLTVQEFYAQKGPFTKQIATEGFSTVSGQLISPL